MAYALLPPSRKARSAAAVPGRRALTLCSAARRTDLRIASQVTQRFVYPDPLSGQDHETLWLGGVHQRTHVVTKYTDASY